MKSRRYSRNRAASAPGGTRDASGRVLCVPSGGAPCARRRWSHRARIARVGRVVRRICRSAAAERAGPPGRRRGGRGGRSARCARSTRAPSCREQAHGKFKAWSICYKRTIFKLCKNLGWKAVSREYVCLLRRDYFSHNISDFPFTSAEKKKSETKEDFFSFSEKGETFSFQIAR